ncbi:Small nuclear RNA activating complex (SNAPc), subunit SNAP43 [Spatholobus suberectus]|nr:Small nuclear RNA activating complex (SNAPc), subunit SNAP43 [Spatholobus suberectus]
MKSNLLIISHVISKDCKKSEFRSFLTTCWYRVLRCKLGFLTMSLDIDYFKQDIDELIGEFIQDESTTLADMKRVWLSRKFSYIYEAAPSTNLAFFMQSLYAHCIGYMVGTASLSHRVGGLYCLYCLYETQPFNPSFKVYVSLGELKKLRILVADAKANDIKVVPALVSRMLERNMFLFGSVDLMEGCVTETVNQLQQLQNARIQVAYEKLFDSTSVDNYVHMDLGLEVDLNLLKKKSSGYAAAKNVAIQEASNILDVENLKNTQQGKELIGDAVEKIANDWHDQKQTFYKQTGLGDDERYGQELEQLLLEQHPHDEDSNQD